MIEKSNRPVVVTHIISGDIWAGAESQAFELLSGLQSGLAIKPTAVVFNPGLIMDKLTNIGIPVTCADERRLSTIEIIKVIRDHLKSNSTDIVHTHGFKENVLGTVAQKLNGVPRSVRTVHGNPETAPVWKNPKRRITDVLDQLIGRFGQDTIVAVSSQLEAHLSVIYPGKTEKIYNFIDINFEEPESNHQILTENQISAPVSVGLVGRLVPVKRVDIFIETIELLRNQLSFPIKGVVIGDGPLMQSLKIQVKKKGLEEVIEFKGFIENPTEELKKLNALIMPSDHEGMPMVLLESLANKIPIVAHAVGGIPEILASGKAGFLVSNHCPKGYAEKVESLLTNAKTTRNISDFGFQHLKKNFDRLTGIEKYQSIYLRLYNNVGIDNLSLRP
ncbi:MULTISPECIES: glycosyltransferase [unclassified Marinobacter]|uniref:glycosyltransferase n=1 Tax=unclassified Marinobacter TaxID=83889 RepID=UPI0009E32F05|nr:MULTISPECIES: glycosyltransferase [unclassified Marinobacter]